jgi:uncharacterized protein
MAEVTIEIPSGLLKRLHHLQTQSDDLKAQIARGPLQVAAAQAVVDKSAAKLAEAKAIKKAALLHANQKQAHLKDRENKIRDLEGKLNMAASNKEFALLKEQIAADKKANEVLSDEIFEALEQIDLFDQEVAAYEAELAEHESQKINRENSIRERLAVMQVDFDETREKLAGEECKLPADVRQLYNRLVEALGAAAMAGTEGNSCGGCNQLLRTQMVDHLQIGRMVQCPTCHALLYASPR